MNKKPKGIACPIPNEVWARFLERVKKQKELAQDHSATKVYKPVAGVSISNKRRTK